MDLASYLKSEIARRSLSVRKAADFIGISHVTLLRILGGETPNLETLHKLSEWTHADLSFLLQLLGYRIQTKTPEMDRLARLIEYDPSYRRLFELIEKLGPQELEFAVDYLEYLTWRLSGQEPGHQAEADTESPAEQPAAGEAETDQSDERTRSPADVSMRE
jgi:transcriptional regulator with XRE-family HTH domain